MNDESEFYFANHYRYMFDKSSDLVTKLEQLIASEIDTLRIALRENLKRLTRELLFTSSFL